ncbi:356_t:CDS:2, partial [Racocetra fulgida]
DQHKIILAAINEFKIYPTNLKCLSINKIAKDYGIPKTTLQYAIKNDSPPNRLGPPTVLTEHEESQLVDQQESEPPFPKKRKIFLFAQLLTCEESWEQLKMANEGAKKKTEEAKRKKEE